MARTAVTPTALTPNASIARPAGTTIDSTLVTNGVEIVAGYAPEELIIEVTNTAAAEKVITVAAGDSPPADAAGQGTTTITLGAGNETPTVGLIGGLTSARFIQSDGTIHVNLASGTTGTLRVYHLPRTA